MKTVKYDKLVRDKIPEILKKKGINFSTRNISDEKQFIDFLILKLKEEVEEFSNDQNQEELADIFEVLNAIIDKKNFSKEKIESIRAKKLEERGGFEEGIVLELTEE